MKFNWKKFYKKMKEKGIKTYQFYDFGCTSTTFARMKENLGISMETLEYFTKLFNCKAEDLYDVLYEDTPKDQERLYLLKHKDELFVSKKKDKK